MIWLPKNAEVDLVWRVMSSFTEGKAQIFQPYAVINSVWYIYNDPGKLITVFRKLFHDIIKWQYERCLNAKIRPYLHFYNWSCCNFFASLMAMWFCSLIPRAARTSFVHPCNPLERHKQWYCTHSVDRPNIVMLNKKKKKQNQGNAKLDLSLRLRKMRPVQIWKDVCGCYEYLFSVSISECFTMQLLLLGKGCLHLQLEYFLLVPCLSGLTEVLDGQEGWYLWACIDILNSRSISLDSVCCFESHLSNQ